MARKFVIASMLHETNTFSPLSTPIESFGPGGPLQGEAAIAELADTNQAIGGFIELARKAGAEFTVPLAANANPSGLVTRAAYEQMCAAILDEIRKGCDAVMLDLHGAMVAEHHDDGEGELLSRIRRLAPGLPIAVALDFHAQMTHRIVDNATIVTGYRTYPHVDMRLTGERAGRTLLRALAGEVVPAMCWGRRPILSSTLSHTPSRQPMKDLMDRAIAAEANGEVLNASIFGGFPQADIPHLGLSAVVAFDVKRPGAGDRGRALLDSLLEQAWHRRDDFRYRGEPLADSIARARTMTEGPVILVDHGDNTASGGTQDVMSVLEEVFRQRLDDVVAGPFCDPLAVERMVEAGLGARVDIDVGGRVDMPALGLKGKPMPLSGKVTAITDGEFVVTGPMATGARVRMGRTAVLDTGRVQVVVSEGRVEPYDLGVFTHCGIDPRRKRYVLIKSRQHFRAGFEPIARHIVECQGLGVTASDISLFDYRRRPKPLHPFESDTRAEDSPPT
ncbi:MAG TPA: M81 family metallopeptidase [Burkholderiaceae bacterium]|nr:M81 family metallopeptidase [Burkholderiaceae bacterium]